jgi:hypothetical protein
MSEPGAEHGVIARQIVGSALAVHCTLGRGFLAGSGFLRCDRGVRSAARRIHHKDTKSAKQEMNALRAKHYRFPS